MVWQDSQSELAQKVHHDLLQKRRRNYRIQHTLIKADRKQVELIYQGDYRTRQIFELIQNGADAIGAAKLADGNTGRIKIVLTKSGLYCANEGEPFTYGGVEAIAFPILSAKSGNAIGRFGQGFKSVLAVTDEPRIYSRSISFQFSFQSAAKFLNAEVTEEEISKGDVAIPKELIGTNENPLISLLSVPIPVNPSDFFSADPILKDLSEWASTIIHLPFNQSARFNSVERFEELRNSLKSFPAEFMIFAGHVHSLEFEIHDQFIEPRNISCVTKTPPVCDLSDDIEVRKVEVDEGGGKYSEWLIATKNNVEIPDSAGNAGVQLETNRRRNPATHALLPVPISWAIPLRGSQEIGVFWSFFPTNDESFLRGIMNAPWDMNTERTKLLTSPYNSHLLKELAHLVVNTIPVLITSFPDDIGKYIDYLPGRAYEEKSSSGRDLNDQIQNAMVVNPSLIDLAGDLQLPTKLRRPPTDVGSNSELINQWALANTNSPNFPHSSLFANRSRLARFQHVLEKADHSAGKQDVNLVDWLEELVEIPTVENSVIALNLVKALADLNFQKREEVIEAKVLLCEDGRLVAPKPGSVFYAIGKSTRTDIPIVDHRIFEAEGIREFLIEECMITEADGAADFDVLLAAWPLNPSDDDWTDFWSATSSALSADIFNALGRHLNVKPVHVRNCEGAFVPCNSVFLPGSILKSGEGDDDRVIDVHFHHGHIEILKLLGVGETPMATKASVDFPDVDGYMSYVSKEVPGFKVTKKSKERIFETAPRWFSELKLLKELQNDSRSRLTTWLLENFKDHAMWKLEATDILVESPGFWFTRNFGLVESSLGPRRFEEALSSSMVQFRRVAPISTVDSEITIGCGLKSVFSELSEEVLVEVLQNLFGEVDSQLIGECLGAICKSLKVPELIPCKVNNTVESRVPQAVAVVVDQEFFEKLAVNGEPVVLAPNADAAESLVSEWGLKAGRDIQQEFEPTSPSEPTFLADLFPLLNEMRPREIVGVNVVICLSLVHVIQGARGQIRVNTRNGLGKNTLFVTQDENNLDEVILSAANDKLGLRLSNDDIRTCVSNAKRVVTTELSKKVRNTEGNVEKIKVLLSIEQMKSLLPVKLLDEIVAEANDPHILAEMLLAVHGPQLLEKSKSILASKGLVPPGSWAGSQTAIQFVAELGFDRAFAGFQEPDRAAHIDVKGRSNPITLHRYQIEVKSEIKKFIETGKEDNKWRATLYLPTGAGKTRVTVQAILELMVEGKLGNRPVIWIAQSYELCEQAIQAFAEVWSEIGTTGVLSLDRFWDNRSVEQASIPDEYAGQVVVAVDAKVVSAAVPNEKYKWLQDASLVVVDEAHRGGSPTYTKILSWLETGVKLFKGKTLDKRPVLGLTATPAKKGIEARFGPRMIRIPDDVIGQGMTDVDYLRSIKVLAIAKHIELPGVTVEGLGDVVVAGDDEGENTTEASSRKRPSIWLPAAVEEQLAEDRDRNASIISSILELDPSWPVIVFALSVSHSQLLAALLAKNGVKSASVSAETSPGIRKLHISDFRSGKIRVLTNYGVLTTGFDAPKVQAIYITRPTFSKSLYLQMIGRGLRGPVNGGTNECLIVDIADNFTNMNIDAAYKEMGDWWTSSEDSTGNSLDDSAET